MAWIKMVAEEEASGRLAELYEKYQEPWGGVDNILKISRQSAINYGNNQYMLSGAEEDKDGMD